MVAHDKEISTGKIDVFFRNLDLYNSRLNKKRVVIPRKNVGLWLEFAFILLLMEYTNIIVWIHDNSHVLEQIFTAEVTANFL